LVLTMRQTFRIVRKDDTFIICEGTEDIDGTLVFLNPEAVDLVSSTEAGLRALLEAISDSALPNKAYKPSVIAYDEDDDTYMIDTDDEPLPVDAFIRAS
jgi:hypothetical protein